MAKEDTGAHSQFNSSNKGANADILTKVFNFALKKIEQNLYNLIKTTNLMQFH